jgi:hypothetical protein
MNVVYITASISQRGFLSQLPSIRPFWSPDTMAAVYDPRCLRDVDNSLHGGSDHVARLEQSQ